MASKPVVPETRVLAIASHVGTLLPYRASAANTSEGCLWVSSPIIPSAVRWPETKSDRIQICRKQNGCICHADHGLRRRCPQYRAIQYADPSE